MTDQSHSTAGTNLMAIDIAKEWNVVLVQETSGQKRNFKVANNAADTSTAAVSCFLKLPNTHCL